MALSIRDRAVISAFLDQAGNRQEILSELKLGRQLVPVRQDNFRQIKWWLKSALLVMADDVGVREAADLIQQKCPPRPVVVIETSVPPAVDVTALKQMILDDCAYGVDIRGIYVQLDDAQNKHQPSSVPIGTRKIHGEKFGTYATKAWHLENTMDYMATWAAALPGLVEGKKVEHGQARKVTMDDAGPCSFEAFCMLLAGKRYVSFHCYPNSR